MASHTSASAWSHGFAASKHSRAASSSRRSRIQWAARNRSAARSTAGAARQAGAAATAAATARSASAAVQEAEVAITRSICAGSTDVMVAAVRTRSPSMSPGTSMPVSSRALSIATLKAARADPRRHSRSGSGS